MFSVTCEQHALFEKVQLVSRGVSGRSTQPIQNNIFLQAAGDKLTLVATDMEFIGVKTTMAVDAAEEGTITVPARILTDLAGRLPAGPVSLVADESNSLKISGGHSEFDIRGLPADDFQQLPELDDPTSFSMTQADLLEILDRTVFATSTDETRPILTGTLFKISGKKLETVATDTYRLALYETLLASEVERDQEAIISRRPLVELQRMLDPDAEAEAEIRISQNQVEFVVSETIIGSRLIDGQFVNYPKVIPTGGDKKITVKCAELASALDRALVVARQDAYRVVLRAKGETMTVSAKSQDVGEAEETLNVSMEGDDAEIAFNAEFLLHMLAAIESEELLLELSGPLNSGLLRPADDENYLYVLMPMQIM